MEELFELVAIIIVAVIGVVTKASKNKKKKQPRDSGSAWDELGSKLSSGIDKVIEIMDDDSGSGIKINIPAVNPAPAAVSVEAAQPVVVPTVAVAAEATPAVAVNDGGSSVEGDCDHPLHEPVALHVPVVPEMHQDEVPAMQLENIASHRSGAFPKGLTAAQLRQAVVMNEVLGRPVALRGAARR